jgi:predicted dehydrogenase
LASKLKVALIGCGEIASYAHLPCYKTMLDAEVVCVMDVIKEKAQKTAHDFGVKKWYSSYEEVLEDSEVQAVDICSPPFMHTQQAVDAAKSGKHILCEKPIATNLSDALAIQSAIEKSGVQFMTGFTYRFHPLIQKIKEELVTPDFLRLNYSFHTAIASDHWINDFNRSGGFIVEQAVHWFDLFQWFSGKAKSVYAKGKLTPLSQNLVATISYENGTLGLISFNANSPQSFLMLTAENANKSAKLHTRLLPSKWGGLLRIFDTSHNRNSYFVNNMGHDKNWKKASLPISFGMSLIQDCHLIPFYRMIQHFARSIQENSQPETSVDNGVDALKVAIAVKNSMEQQKEVTIPP